MIYTLKIYDTELMTFELTQKPLEGFCCQIVSVNDGCKHLLPLAMTVDGDGVLSWLKSRFLPSNRANSDRVLSVYGLTHNNIPGIIQLCKGLSLNDSYWITDSDFKGKFADYNLFENSFYKALSLIAYTGYGSVKPSGFSSSPEFTTNGMLRKGYPRPLINRKWNVPQDLDLTRNHQTLVWARWLREACGLKQELDFSPIAIGAEKQMRIGLICGTENSPEKRWPVERWRELVALLQKARPELQIYLFGTAKDGAITAQVAEGQNANVIDRAGKTDLPAYMRELASCRAICGNDTGGMHLANMLGVPVVGIFGPTNPVRTGPIFNAPVNILQPEGCPPTGGADIRGVSADRACAALEKFL